MSVSAIRTLMIGITIGVLATSASRLVSVSKCRIAGKIRSFLHVS